MKAAAAKREERKEDVDGEYGTEGWRRWRRLASRMTIKLPTRNLNNGLLIVEDHLLNLNFFNVVLKEHVFHHLLLGLVLLAELLFGLLAPDTVLAGLGLVTCGPRALPPRRVGQGPMCDGGRVPGPVMG